MKAPTPAEWQTMRARAVERIAAAETELATAHDLLERCDTALEYSPTTPRNPDSILEIARRAGASDPVFMREADGLRLFIGPVDDPVAIGRALYERGPVYRFLGSRQVLITSGVSFRFERRPGGATPAPSPAPAVHRRPGRESGCAVTALERVNAARAELAAAEAALFSDRVAAVDALANLLGRMFSADELRRAMYRFHGVTSTLPGALASHGAMVDAVVRGLLLTGVDAPTLRAWLVAERPRRIPEIDAALSLWGAP